MAHDGGVFGWGMSSTVILGSTWPALEKRLLADLAGTELSPRWVVTPSATLANHVRTRLARSATDRVFANVRVVNLPVLAARLIRGVLGKQVAHWSVTHELLLSELIATLPGSSTLSPLRAFDGGTDLLRQAFVDLGEGGFGQGEQQTLRDLAGEKGLAKRERDTLEAYVKWLDLLENRKTAWEPLVLQELSEALASADEDRLLEALGCESGQAATIHVHGFYDFIDVNLEWLTALAKRVDCQFYYPFHGALGKPHPAFAFADSVLSDLLARLGQPEPETIPSPANSYFLDTFPDGHVDRQPVFVTTQTASGIRAEAISAAVKIRQWLDDPVTPLSADDILVVAPDAEAYADTVHEVFGAFAIPVRVVDVSAGPDPATVPLRMLARIWEDRAPAEWVLALLRAAPTAKAVNGVDIDRFEGKVRELAVWGGESWRAAQAKESFVGVDEDGERRREVTFNVAEKKLLDAICSLICDAETLTASQALDVLQDMLRRWLPEEPSLTGLIDAVDALVSRSPSFALSRKQWARLLAAGCGNKNQRDPMCHGVLFAPLMRARGVTARATVFLGLAAGQMPFRVMDDPFLSEGVANRLAAVAREIGHRLPLKSETNHEMLLLFYLINTSADRVHWVVPETDADGKAVAPTPWVQRYRAGWDRAGSVKLPRIGRSPSEQAAYLWTLDRQTGSFVPPTYGATVWAGARPVADSSNLFRSVASCVSIKRVGVTSLEHLAKCPFHFYARHVARWEAIEPLALSHGLDALNFGTLLHKLLELAVKDRLGRTTMEKIADLVLAGNADELRRLLDKVPSSEPDAAFALAMLPEIFRRSALDLVLKKAVAYFEWARENQIGTVPVDVEVKYEKAWPGLDRVTISGRIDRVDRNGDVTTMIDFKSGKKPSDYYAKKVALGWLIQAAVYPWLCDKPDAGFQYVYLGRGEPVIGDGASSPTAEDFMRALGAIVQSGRYVAVSNQVLEELGIEKQSSCRYCEFGSACRRFEPGAPARCAEVLREVASDRVNAMIAAAGGETKEAQATS
jgi:hypothetical protein